ncbi:MAG: AmmeMemoRadiSam system protein A [Thermodesulfobacteriota bacterium]
MALSDSDKEVLFSVARASIKGYLAGKKMPEISESRAEIQKACGAFVTIHKGGALRGCIGLFVSEKPLYKTVADMAVSAAFEDPRFPPLNAEELSEIDLEISVLTPLKKIQDASEIEVGRDGIYIIKGHSRGVLLPQVATEHGFDRETFLDQTCLKAGLAPGSWREGAEIYTFEAEIINEKE